MLRNVPSGTLVILHCWGNVIEPQLQHVQLFKLIESMYTSVCSLFVLSSFFDGPALTVVSPGHTQLTASFYPWPSFQISHLFGLVLIPTHFHSVNSSEHLCIRLKVLHSNLRPSSKDISLLSFLQVRSSKVYRVNSQAGHLWEEMPRLCPLLPLFLGVQWPYVKAYIRLSFF